MKKHVLFIFIIPVVLALAGCATTATLPFAGHTKNKPVTRMTQQQWRQARLGNTFYTRCNGKQYKNTMKIRQYNKQNGR